MHHKTFATRWLQCYFLGLLFIGFRDRAAERRALHGQDGSIPAVNKSKSKSGRKASERAVRKERGRVERRMESIKRLEAMGVRLIHLNDFILEKWHHECMDCAIAFVFEFHT